MNLMKQIWPIVWKDMLSELRTKEVVLAMCFFACLVLIIFNFAFFTGMGDTQGGDTQGILAGMLWVAFLFAGVLGLNQTFGAEKDREVLQGLLLCPVNRASIYISKVISNLLFMSIMETLILGLFAVLFRVALWKVLPALGVIIVLGTLGFVCVGTILAAMAVNARAREILLTVILFPMLVPVIIAAVKATEKVLAGAAFPEITGWLKLLVAFDLIFFLLAYGTFDFVLSE